MNPQRNQSLLRGQSAIAQKVYQFITCDPGKSSSVIDIAAEMKAATGAGADIHIMRGCLAALCKAGLVREVVPGSFRQTVVKEKKDMSVVKSELETVVKPITKTIKKPAEPMDRLAAISSRLRAEAEALIKIADEIDAEALAAEERRTADSKELAVLEQFKAILKG